MRCRFLILTVCLVANASTAQQDLLACVDPDVSEGLQPTPIGVPLSCAVPDELAGLELPAELVFFGSIEGLYRHIALYRSAWPPKEAVDAVTAALHDAGWRNLAIDALTGSGFEMGGPLPHRLLCRDTSTLNVHALAFYETTEVRLLVATHPRAPSCDVLLGDDGGGIDEAGPEPDDYPPSLALPGGVASMDPRAGLVPSLAAFSDSGRSMSTGIDSVSALSPQHLVEDFGRQLQALGRAHDAGWSGEYSSGTSWTRSLSEDLLSVGLLDVVSLGDTGYRATFRFSSPDPQ